MTMEILQQRPCGHSNTLFGFKYAIKVHTDSISNAFSKTKWKKLYIILVKVQGISFQYVFQYAWGLKLIGTHTFPGFP